MSPPAGPAGCVERFVGCSAERRGLPRTQCVSWLGGESRSFRPGGGLEGPGREKAVGAPQGPPECPQSSVPHTGHSWGGGWPGEQGVSVCTPTGRDTPQQSRPSPRACGMCTGQRQASPGAGDTERTASGRRRGAPGCAQSLRTSTEAQEARRGVEDGRERERENRHPPGHF